MFLNKCFDNFELKEQIGKGEFGEVFRAEDVNSKKSYAVKTINLKNIKQGIPSSAIREITILRQLNHPNIIRLHSLMNHDQTLYLVLDLCDCDLRTYFLRNNHLLPISECKKIIFQILKALEYLNSKQIMHRDFKPQNILVSKTNNNFTLIKIADFGLARMCNLPIENYTPEVVTRWYRAPELLLGSTKYNESIEMWSIGCILVETLTKKAFFPGKDETDQLKKVFDFFGRPRLEEWPECFELPNFKTLSEMELSEKKEIAEYFSELGEPGIDLIERMLRLNPLDRISVEDALLHVWFDEIRKEVNSLYA